jgi:hypothetical protein
MTQKQVKREMAAVGLGYGKEMLPQQHLRYSEKKSKI